MFNTLARFSLSFVCSTRPGYTFIILQVNVQLSQCHFLLYVPDAFVANQVSLCVGVHLGFFISFIWSSHPCHASSKPYSFHRVLLWNSKFQSLMPLPFFLCSKFLGYLRAFVVLHEFQDCCFSSSVKKKKSLKILYRLHLAYSLIYGNFVNVNYSDPQTQNIFRFLCVLSKALEFCIYISCL